jgi:hypothetical protein
VGLELPSILTGHEPLPSVRHAAASDGAAPPSHATG